MRACLATPLILPLPGHKRSSVLLEAIVLQSNQISDWINRQCCLVISLASNVIWNDQNYSQKISMMIGSEQETTQNQSEFFSSSLRDAFPFQNGWIFGKVPNSLWPPAPPLIFGKLRCNFFPKFMTEVSSIMAKICNINFWIENDHTSFGTFPKIHPFWKGSASLILGQKPRFLTWIK